MIDGLGGKGVYSAYAHLFLFHPKEGTKMRKALIVLLVAVFGIATTASAQEVQFLGVDHGLVDEHRQECLKRLLPIKEEFIITFIGDRNLPHTVMIGRMSEKDTLGFHLATGHVNQVSCTTAGLVKLEEENAPTIRRTFWMIAPITLDSRDKGISVLQIIADRNSSLQICKTVLYLASLRKEDVEICQISRALQLH